MEIFNFSTPGCWSFEDIVTDGLANRMKAMTISKA
jgi:hypothetical protein